MHAKYEVSTSNGSKVIAKVKVDNRQTNKQNGQKQYAPDHSIRGHNKKVIGEVIVLRRNSDYGYITAPHLVAFYDTLGIRRMYSRLKSLASPRGA